MIYPFYNAAYNCKQATLLVVKKAEGELTLFETLKLRYHFLFCDPCKQFMKQWAMLEQLPSIELPQFKLSDESRTRIQKRIEEE
jgi:hypothetical protein